MKKVITIDFRPQTEAPLEEGWYYGQHKQSTVDPEPYMVVKTGGRLIALSVDEPLENEMDHIRWFGPVTEVREASKGE